MSFLFGSRKTSQEIMRENQRAINKSIREMDRERVKMENQEKKLINDIRREATKGNQDIVKIMAKDLVRTRKHIKKLTMMKVQLQAVSLKIQELKTTDAMAQAMKGCTKAMARMNKSMNLPAMQKIMMEFEKQSEMMDMKSEMMSDVIDDVIEDAEDEEESEEIVNKVLDELGLSLGQDLVDAPTGIKGAAKEKPQAVAADGGEDDLQARLDALRKS
eukprot:comp10869_c0_seq1/m.5477 comp10869_c0_seq1/g.5477  ORF comp10869_c0_seq1/g.5477 comp10869_c0_seq1/m.5477 type:complete len:217 (-) comp10869_c0_seq1:702-1352(-)